MAAGKARIATKLAPLAWYLLIAVLFLSVGQLRAEAQVTPPDEYAAATIAVGLDDGRDIVATPDGRLLIALGTGDIRVLENDVLLAAPMLTIPVGNGGNKGLHTLALDQDFIQNGFIYAVFTPEGADFNRLSRFTVTGNTADLLSEVQILDLPPLDGSVTHYGGAVVDAGDGTLLVTVGDHEVAANGQNLATLTGTVLRVNKDGTIPADNPYVGDGSVDDRIYAHGLRNPWQAAFKASNGQVVISDVGSSLWEEVNVLTAGGNYGWADAEGAGGPGLEPLFTYPHFGLVPGAEFEGCAVTGGTFYEPDVVQLPSRYVGQLFVGDLCDGWIVAIDTETGATEAFATGFDSLADLATNPANGALYALDRNLVDNRSGIIKIEYVGENVTLRITSQPTTQRLAIGQRASFFVGAIGQGNLQYQWQRDGVDIPGATDPTYAVDPVTADDDGAQFRAIVSDDLGEITSSVAEIIVTDNHAPEPFITEPPEGQTYAGGDQILLMGGATDLEDGDLAATALTWEVRLNHGEHDHGFSGTIVGTDEVTITIPQGGETSDDVWYTVYLTAEDADGASTTVTRIVSPRKVSLTFDTAPTGGVLNIDGPPQPTPHQIVAVEGIFREVQAPRVQELAGEPHGFTTWSDGGAREHTYTTPAAVDTLTATYEPLPFGDGTNPECFIARMDDAAVITFSGDLGSSVNLLRNGAWIQTVTGLEYYVDGDSPGANASYLMRVRTNGVPVDHDCAAAQWPPGDPPPPPAETVCEGTVDGSTVTLAFSGDLGTSANVVRNGSWLATVTGLSSYVDVGAPPGATYVLRTRTAGVSTDTDCTLDGDPPPPPAETVCEGTVDGSTVTLAFSGDLGTSANVVRNGSWLATVTGLSSYVDVGAPPGATYVLRTRTAGVSTDTDCTLDGDPPPPPAETVCEGTVDGSTVTLAFSGDLGTSANVVRNGSWLATVTGLSSYVDVGAPPGATYVLRTRTAGVSTDTDCTLDGDPPPPPAETVCEGTVDGSTVTLAFSGDLGTSANVVRNGSWLATVTGLSSYVDVGAPPGATYVLRTRTAGVSTDTDCTLDGDPGP